MICNLWCSIEYVKLNNQDDNRGLNINGPGDLTNKPMYIRVKAKPSLEKLLHLSKKGRPLKLKNSSLNSRL